MTDIYDYGSTYTQQYLTSNTSVAYSATHIGVQNTDSSYDGASTITVKVHLRKVGSPTGTVYVKIADSSDTVQASGSLSASGLTTSFAQYTFSISTTWYQDYRCYVEYSVDAGTANYVEVAMGYSTVPPLLPTNWKNQAKGSTQGTSWTDQSNPQALGIYATITTGTPPPPSSETVHFPPSIARVRF